MASKEWWLCEEPERQPDKNAALHLHSCQACRDVVQVMVANGSNFVVGYGRWQMTLTELLESPLEKMSFEDFLESPLAQEHV